MPSGCQPSPLPSLPPGPSTLSIIPFRQMAFLCLAPSLVPPLRDSPLCASIKQHFEERPAARCR